MYKRQCICCPLGCRIEVALDENGQVSEVSGYTCKRGADYAAQEAVAPERMVTAVLCVSGCLEPVSVKTQRPVPKAAMKDVLAAVAALRLDAPVAAGDVPVSYTHLRAHETGRNLVCRLLLEKKKKKQKKERNRSL